MVQVWLAKQTKSIWQTCNTKILKRNISKSSWYRSGHKDTATTLLPIPRNAMSTSPSTEPLRRRFAGPGSSRSATPPMFRLPRYYPVIAIRYQYHWSPCITTYLLYKLYGQILVIIIHEVDLWFGIFQGDDLKPNTWCQKMPRKICAPDNCNMVQVGRARSCSEFSEPRLR